MQHSNNSSNRNPSGDEDLLMAVMDAISRSEPLRGRAMNDLLVEVSGGKVVISGVVASAALRIRAGQLASMVDGVDLVENRLVTSEEVEGHISRALAADPITHRFRIAVKVVDRTASLYGAVETKEEAERAGKVAAAAAEGLEITNRLQLLPPGRPALLLWQQSVEGRQEVATMKAAREAEAQRAADSAPEIAPDGAPTGGDSGGDGVRIGAHVSTSGGVPTAIGRALEIGANCIQIFAGPPQRWAGANFSDEDVAEFRRLTVEHDVRPVFIHSSYLINLASSDPILRERSISALLSGLQWGEKLGASGVITHLGSSKDGDIREAERLVADAIAGILNEAPASVQLLVETCAGQGNTIGRKFEQIGDLVKSAGSDPRMAVCLDTAHIFEAGYDIATESGLAETLELFDRVVGLQKLAAIHVNDSKTALGSNVDRHENIGHGLLGDEAIGRIMRHPATRHLPFLLEVPGLAKEGPDRPNIDALRRLAGLTDA